MKGSLYMHTCIKIVAKRACFDSVVSDGIQYPEFFDDTRPFAYDECDEDIEHTPTFSLVTLALIITAVCNVVTLYIIMFISCLRFAPL